MKKEKLEELLGNVVSHCLDTELSVRLHGLESGLKDNYIEIIETLHGNNNDMYSSMWFSVKGLIEHELQELDEKDTKTTEDIQSIKVFNYVYGFMCDLESGNRGILNIKHRLDKDKKESE